MKTNLHHSFMQARRISDLIGNFKKPFNQFCSEFLWNQEASEHDSIFHLTIDEDLTELSEEALESAIEKTLRGLGSLLEEAQRREIEVIKEYARKTN